MQINPTRAAVALCPSSTRHTVRGIRGRNGSDFRESPPADSSAGDGSAQSTTTVRSGLVGPPGEGSAGTRLGLCR